MCHNNSKIHVQFTVCLITDVGVVKGTTCDFYIKCFWMVKAAVEVKGGGAVVM